MNIPGLHKDGDGSWYQEAGSERMPCDGEKYLLDGYGVAEHCEAMDNIDVGEYPILESITLINEECKPWGMLDDHVQYDINELCSYDVMYMSSGGWVNILLGPFAEEPPCNAIIVGVAPKPAKAERWRAEEGEYYWYVSLFGEPIRKKDHRNLSDRDIYNLGNYFQTKELAQGMADKIRNLLGAHRERVLPLR